MQGHPESSRLWEKHIDSIIKDVLQFRPTTQEPCLYVGEIDGTRVLFLRQVDDFSVACQNARIADIVWDMLDSALSIPLKRMGLVTLFNGMDITQTRHYVKIHCTTYIKHICEKYLSDWMTDAKVGADRPLPLPFKESLLKEGTHYWGCGS